MSITKDVSLRKGVAEKPIAPSLPIGRITSRVLTHVILIVGAVVMLLPFFWMLSTSVKEAVEATQFPPAPFPKVWRWDNYVTAWTMVPWPRYFANTLFVAGTTTLLVLTTASLAGYAFARMRFAGKNALFVLFLATMMIPAEVTLIPNFVTITQLRWYNSYLGLIIPFSSSVFAIFLLRQFFMTIPQELYDAARIDGCDDFRFFRRIALPLARPALLTVTLLTMTSSWNALLWPLIATSDKEMRLLQVGLQAYQNEASALYNLQMAAATFTLLPIVLLYIGLQRYFIETLASSGVKG